jgi:hypothetical protein
MSSISAVEAAVSKGGLSVIYGGMDKGIRWSQLLLESLLVQLIDSARFTSIVLISSDHSFALQCQANSDKIKVTVMQPDLRDSAGIDVIEARVIDITRESELPIAVLVHSFSDFLLRYGSNPSIKFLSKLKDITRATSLSPSHSSHSLAIAVINQSLLLPSLLARLQLVASALLYLKPNNGTMAEEVLFEVHVIRRSMETGKVSENVDMFVANSNAVSNPNTIAALVIPVPKRREIDEADKDRAHLPQKQQQQPEDLMKRLQEPISMRATPETLSADKARSLPRKQLVTFDSSDPDFDEDDDPDDDLDL